jgi:hypothetical protein
MRPYQTKNIKDGYQIIDVIMQEIRIIISSEGPLALFSVAVSQKEF